MQQRDPPPIQRIRAAINFSPGPFKVVLGTDFKSWNSGKPVFYVNIILSGSTTNTNTTQVWIDGDAMVVDHAQQLGEFVAGRFRRRTFALGSVGRRMTQ